MKCKKNFCFLFLGMILMGNITYANSSIDKTSDDLKISVQYSKHNAILIFLEHLSSNSENEFKKVYKNSIYNNEENNKLIDRFGNLDWYFAKNNFRFKSTRFLKSICMRNDSWHAIKNEAIGLLPNVTLFELIDILQHFEPIYNEIVYVPTKDKFNIQLNCISKLVEEKKIAKYFNKVKSFIILAGIMKFLL